MRNSGGKFIMGAVLVIFGILMIFGNIGFFNINWITHLTAPMIIIAISLAFFMGYFAKRPYGSGLLVPAGILFTVGVTLFFNTFTDIVWPGYIAAPAVGLLLLYLFGERSPGLLVPVGIILTVAGTCLFGEIFNAWDIAWPGFIIAPAVGLFLLYLTGKHEPGLLIPIFILAGIAITFFTVFTLGRFAESIKYIIGGVLVLAGLSTILRRPGPRNRYDHHDDYGGTPGM